MKSPNEAETQSVLTMHWKKCLSWKIAHKLMVSSDFYKQNLLECSCSAGDCYWTLFFLLQYHYDRSLWCDPAPLPSEARATGPLVCSGDS